MVKIGLSGNRYSGKDRVAALFKQIGVPVFDVDTILKFILNHNYELLGDIRSTLGNDIFLNDSIDFNKLKNKEVFDNVLDIVESDIFSAYYRFNQKNKDSIYTIFHSSILFEREWYTQMSKNISVFSPKNDRIKRCNYLTGKGLLTINDLISTEMDPLVKNSLSDYVIHNYNDDFNSSFGDVLKQISDTDQKIVDEYILKLQTVS